MKKAEGERADRLKKERLDLQEDLGHKIAILKGLADLLSQSSKDQPDRVADAFYCAIEDFSDGFNQFCELSRAESRTLRGLPV